MAAIKKPAAKKQPGVLESLKALKQKKDNFMNAFNPKKK